jgi:hypothetical protein
MVPQLALAFLFAQCFVYLYYGVLGVFLKQSLNPVALLSTGIASTATTIFLYFIYRKGEKEII